MHVGGLLWAVQRGAPGGIRTHTAALLRGLASRARYRLRSAMERQAMRPSIRLRHVLGTAPCPQALLQCDLLTRAMKVQESLGYEANGTRPTPLIGSRGVPPSQGRPSMASHPIRSVRPLPMASLLLFLLRQLTTITCTGARLPHDEHRNDTHRFWTVGNCATAV
jgi:hypothetical protein